MLASTEHGSQEALTFYNLEAEMSTFFQAKIIHLKEPAS